MMNKLPKIFLSSTMCKALALCAIAATVMVSGAVRASTQPMDWETIYEDVLFNEESDSTSEVIRKVPPIVSAVRQIFQSINAGSVDGAVNGILGILGELGLLDPADESSRVGEGGTINDDSSSGNNPYSNPENPEEVYELQRYTDVVRSEIPQKHSQIVFGPQGQKTMAQQTEDLQQAQMASIEAAKGTNNAYEESVKLSEENADSAQTVEAEAESAQSSKASQDVLKAIASQNGSIAKIYAGTSSQLAQIGKAASYQAAQTLATNTQLTALNDKTQVLQILSASQNYQLAQVDAAIDHQSHYQQIKDSWASTAASQSSNVVYIPGLVESK